MPSVTASRPLDTEQLAAYEVGARVYDQVIAIHSNIATVANIYLLITGVLWTAYVLKVEKHTGETRYLVDSQGVPHWLVIRDDTARAAAGAPPPLAPNR